jgi:hypothetical protein
MGEILENQLAKLANESKFNEIKDAIEQMPESEWDYNIVQHYVRALNNCDEHERAAEISLRFKEQGENDALWHCRYAYALWHLNKNSQAEAEMAKAKDLSGANHPLGKYIDSFMEHMEDYRQRRKEEPVPEQMPSREFVFISKGGGNVSVCLVADRLVTLSDKMQAVNDAAYMNGYNWEAFFSHYLSRHIPDLLDGMKTDSEAGTYVAYYPLTPQNEAKAERFADLIRQLVGNEDELLRIVREEGDEIEWD